MGPSISELAPPNPPESRRNNPPSCARGEPPARQTSVASRLPAMSTPAASSLAANLLGDAMRPRCQFSVAENRSPNEVPLQFSSMPPSGIEW